MEGISKKIYLELQTPTEEDSRSDQSRILDALKERQITARMTLDVFRKLYPLCDAASWNLTVSLAWDGSQWTVTDLEAGDTTGHHYGLAVALGSTTVAVSLVDCCLGACMHTVSGFNRQISFGTDILTRIFFCKDNPDALEQVRLATLQTILELLKLLEAETGVPASSCIQMVVSGNTTMIHFLLGMDAFCVFSSPYAVRADHPGFLPGSKLGLPISGYVYCFPSKSNYLGGDIVSGIAATGLHREDEICVFFDIGTNGELVVGNRDFLLCGAGAAGPALEGGVVRTGMRADTGAVDQVRLSDGQFWVHVIGEAEARGICGSGIVDLIAQLFLNGWMDLRGKLIPEKSPLIRSIDGMAAAEYAPGLLFYQSDVDEFLKTKAAACTMVEYMLKESGIPMEEIAKFYVAGAFGKHVSKESAVTIGLYPDMDRNRIIHAGNASLEGAKKLLLCRDLLGEIGEILEKMVYIQFGAVEEFLHLMVAAQAIPHTDLERYPSVKAKLEGRFQDKPCICPPGPN